MDVMVRSTRSQVSLALPRDMLGGRCASRSPCRNASYTERRDAPGARKSRARTNAHGGRALSQTLQAEAGSQR